MGAFMKLFVLSKENIDISKAEAERLHSEEGRLIENLLFLDVDWKPGLAFTRSIHEVLFEVEGAGLDEAAGSFAWHEQVESPFAIRAYGLVDEKTFAGYVWRALETAGKEASVDLTKPKTLITLYSIDEKVYVTKQLWVNEERFFDRRA
ncbi:hypothetical protein GOV07_03655, partial [Candidatus Woesearchaeota archaeon]|nr:hypothetical protein [Candidatus Woesearchaeota archaeon]